MTKKQLLFLIIGVYLLFPVHELCHLWVVNEYDVEIQDISFFPYPQITVNEYDFPHLVSLFQYYTIGVTVPFTVAVMYRMFKKNKTKLSVSYLWLTLAPVTGLTDLENLCRIFNLLDYTKWIHLGLGMYLMYNIERIIQERINIETT